MSEQKYTVTEINDFMKDTLNEALPDKITVDGEISNLKFANDNIFFTLKDDESSINVVGWKYSKNKNKIDLNVGDKVSVIGKITLYSKSGNINFTLHKINKVGLGELHKEYQILKEKCEKLGYFDNQKKKSFPTNIKNIGIVTAPEGAALQDVLYVFKKNNFNGNIIIKRSIVQGNLCSKSIANSIEYLNNWKDSNNNKLDLILITRGGGSFEDLMGFSDIKVIEAIHNSDIYTISAVGHEVDYMLSDFTADKRAPTPSVAAEIISSSQKKELELLEQNIAYYRDCIKNLILEKVGNNIYKLENLRSRIKNPLEMIDHNINALNEYNENLKNSINLKIEQQNNKINQLEQGLEKYNIDKMLQSGYVLLIKRGKIYDSVKNLEVDQKLKIKLKDGEVEIKINKIKIDK